MADLTIKWSLKFIYLKSHSDVPFISPIANRNSSDANLHNTLIVTKKPMTELAAKSCYATQTGKTSEM